MNEPKTVSEQDGSKHFSDARKVQVIEDEVMFIDNLREVANLSSIRIDYNTFVFCRAGRIVVEIGNNVQVKVNPGDLLLIPTHKVVQPMLLSTDVQAGALLVSDKVMNSVLGSQASIWNKAMYMKEIYVVEQVKWMEGMGNYTRTIFKDDQATLLFNEIMYSFLRMMLLLVCENLLRNEKMSVANDASTPNDKEIFNQFLLLLSKQKQKRQQVSYYANCLNITPKYLSSVSKRVSGKNPMRWITESVMEDCYTLLRDTNLSVKEISNRLGFPNSSFFGQYFREQAGLTPVEYRLKHKTVA